VAVTAEITVSPYARQLAGSPAGKPCMHMCTSTWRNLNIATKAKVAGDHLHQAAATIQSKPFEASIAMP